MWASLSTDAEFSLLVFPAGLQKLHGVVRPLSLKTDVIKKRWAISFDPIKTRVADYGRSLISQEPSFWRAKLGCPQEQHCTTKARLVLHTAALVNNK
jgi:hypothetical protein